MRCALLPCNIDVRLNPARVSFSDWNNGILYYFCLPNGTIYEIGAKINDSGVPIDCSYCRITYSSEYDDSVKIFMALEEIPWLKLPVIIREKIWQTLTGQERCFEYDEDEANFVYYGKSEDFIWAVTHCIISIEITLKIISWLGKRFREYRRIGYKELYNQYSKNGEELHYLIDSENVVIIHALNGHVSFKIKSWKNLCDQKRKREQLIEELSHTVEIPIEIASLLSSKMNNKEKTVEFLKMVKARKLEFGEQLKIMGAGKSCYYFDYFANLRDLRVVLGEDLLKVFAFEWKGDPLKLINYLIN